MSHYKERLLKYIAIPVGLIIILLCFYLAYQLHKQDQEEILRTSGHVAELVQSEVKSIVAIQIDFLSRMGKRWEQAKGLSYEAWRKDAQAYIDFMRNGTLLTWIDPDFKVRWVVPIKKQKDFLNLNLSSNKKYYSALQRADDQKKIIMSEVIPFDQEKGIAVFVPLIYHNNVQGFLGGIFEADGLFQSLLKQKLVENYSIKITEKGEILHQRGEPVTQDTAPFLQTIPLQVYNVDWIISVWPDSQVLSSLNSYMPLGIAAIGILLGSLIALLLFLVGQRLQVAKEALQSKKDMFDTTEKIRLILEKANEGFISINEQGRIINWNPFATKLFGWAYEEAIGRPLHQLIIPPCYREMHVKGMEKFLETGEGPVLNKTIEITGYHRLRGEFPIELTVFPTQSNKVYTFHAFIRDITERKTVEKMKNEFISVVSHELRTPLTAIKGSISLMLGQKEDALSPKFNQLLTIAQNNCDRLIRLINDILDIEKIEAGKMELKRVPMKATTLIEDAININIEYAHKFNVGIALEKSVDVSISGDYDRLIQVLTNLISNAVKFSPPKTVVSINLAVKDHNLQIAVQDKGPGISQEFQSKIFEKFSQSDSSSARAKGGTGLGLSISKAIVEMHHGKIYFQTEDGAGATFFVELPLLETKEVPKKPIKKPFLDGQKKPKILVCEDDKDCAKLLSMMLEQFHCNVDIAYTAEEAKQFLANNHYEAMTLDLMLPDQNGISFIKEMQRKNGETVPIIVVSAIAQKGKQELNGNAFHVAGWIEKPIHEEQLTKLLGNVVAKFPNQRIRILHVEDDPDIQKISQMLLETEATVIPAKTLQEAKKMLQNDSFDLVVLDLELPDGNAADLLPIINWKTKQIVPVVVFSAHELEQEYAKYVDDQLMKSAASNEELVATIKSVINKISSR